jgi:hypothetical protein
MVFTSYKTAHCLWTSHTNNLERLDLDGVLCGRGLVGELLFQLDGPVHDAGRQQRLAVQQDGSPTTCHTTVNDKKDILFTLDAC